MNKLSRLLLLSIALIGLAPLSEAFALGAYGGSAFPLTFITQPVTNQTDEFNQLLLIMNSQCVAQTNSPALTVQDSVFKIQDDGDATKQFVTQLSGQSTATTATLATTNTGNATYTLPAATDTVAGLGTSETFTGTDVFNGATTFGSASTFNSAVTVNNSLTLGTGSSIVTQGIVYGNALANNPPVQAHFQSFLTASVNAVVNVLNSATGRTIYPNAGLSIMASGTASGATSVQLICTPSATIIASWPIAALVTNVPQGAFYSNAIGAQKSLTAGCSSGDAVALSTNGTLATTTQIFVNLPYTVQ